MVVFRILRLFATARGRGKFPLFVYKIICMQFSNVFEAIHNFHFSKKNDEAVHLVLVDSRMASKKSLVRLDDQEGGAVEPFMEDQEFRRFEHFKAQSLEDNSRFFQVELPVTPAVMINTARKLITVSYNCISEP